MAGLRVRGALLAAVVAGSALVGWLGTAPSAAAVGCTISGSIGGPDPAYVGQTLSAYASVASFGSCRAKSIAIVSNSDGRILCQRELSNANRDCSAFFLAYPGLHTVSGVLSTGQSAAIGTFTVIDEPPPSSQPPRSTPPAPPTSASRPTATVTRSATARASSSAARSTPARAATTWLPNFGAGDDSAGPSASAAAVPVASRSSAPPIAPAGEMVIHGSGSVAVPASLLLPTLLVLAALGAVATRLVYVHVHASG